MRYRTQSKAERISAIIDRKIGKFTKKEIMDACPDISRITIERTLASLVKERIYCQDRCGTDNRIRQNGQAEVAIMDSIILGAGGCVSIPKPKRFMKGTTLRTSI